MLYSSPQKSLRVTKHHQTADVVRWAWSLPLDCLCLTLTGVLEYDWLPKYLVNVWRWVCVCVLICTSDERRRLQSLPDLIHIIMRKEVSPKVHISTRSSRLFNRIIESVLDTLRMQLSTAVCFDGELGAWLVSKRYVKHKSACYKLLKPCFFPREKGEARDDRQQCRHPKLGWSTFLWPLSVCRGASIQDRHVGYGAYLKIAQAIHASFFRGSYLTMLSCWWWTLLHWHLRIILGQETMLRQNSLVVIKHSQVQAL